MCGAPSDRLSVREPTAILLEMVGGWKARTHGNWSNNLSSALVFVHVKDFYFAKSDLQGSLQNQ